MNEAEQPQQPPKETPIVETTTDAGGIKPAPKPTERPDPAWVRGKCPQCGDVVISNLYYVGGKGYLLIWQCWSNTGENATCDYRKVL